jgi:hypothetical protein
MSIQSDWNTVNSTYNTLNAKISDLKLNYLEINNDSYITSPEIVSIGCLCNNHSTNLGLKMTQFWNMPDTIINNITNAKKIINQYYWNEKQNISNPNVISRKPGLACKTNAAAHYATNSSVSQKLMPDVRFFSKTDVTSYMTDFTQPLQANTAIDLFGYFIPNMTGDWTFSIAPSDGTLTFSSLWISSDNAVFDYTMNNVDIVPGAANPTFTISLIQGECYSIRLQIANMTASPITNPLLSVVAPNGNLISGSGVGGIDLFTTLTNGDGSVYNKQLLYFAMLQNATNTSLYNCYFITPPAVDNYNTIMTLKTNDPIQLQTKNVPLSLTYSGDQTVTNTAGTSTSVTLPPGVNITIKSATWGILTPATTVYYTPQTVPATGYVQATTNSVVGAADSSEPGQTVNYSLLPYNYPSSKIIQQRNTKVAKLSTDVKDKVQQLVNKSSLQIGGSDYTTIFGDPTATYSLAQSYPLQLQVEYTYNSVVDQSAITAPFIYLNNRGSVKVGYVWGGINCESDFNFDTTYNPCGMQCTYKMVLDDSGKFCIYDGKNMVTSKDFPKLMNVDTAQCIVNEEWLTNPNYKRSLGVNEKLGEGGVHELVSANGKFQVFFSGNQLVFEYCLNPNKSTSVVKIADNSVDMHYTSNVNVDQLGYQLYFLYRLNTRGLSGQRFMSQVTSTDNILNYVPPYPNSNNIMKFDSFESKNGLYPMTFPITNNPNYTVISQNVTDDSVCNKSCVNSPTCDHYFYLTDKLSNNYCILDNKNVLNPVYTDTSISNVQSSTLNKKNFKINTTCGSLPNKNFQSVTNNQFNTGAVSLTDLAQNAPNLTYYCGLQGYQTATNVIHGIYDTADPSSRMTNTTVSNPTVNPKAPITSTPFSKTIRTGTHMAGFSNMENFTDNSPYKVVDQSNISTLSQMSGKFGALENKIADNNLQINNTIGRYVDLSNNLGMDMNYKFTGPDAVIPNKYVATLSSRPEATFADGVKRDLEIITTQQNTLYTIAAITTASLIILTIFVIK